MTTPSDLEFERLLEDLLARQRGGQRLELDDLLECYPKHADDLRGFFNDSKFLSPYFAEARAPFTGGSRCKDTSFHVETKVDSEAECSSLPEVRGFEVLEELGSGSQGIVYKALQLGTKRIVALKVIRDGLFASARERLRFENETQVAARLKHPNLVSIYGSGSERGRDYFCMEYADGEPLDLYLSTRTLTIEETVELFLPICDAVNYAHQRGVIHRDLKPANILVDREGQPHVLDFGLAKQIDNSDVVAITQVGSFAGTWYYASPEQVRHENRGADVRSDVYALGVMLYEAATDAFPYPIRGASPELITYQIVNADPVRPSSIRRDIGDEFETIILQALQKDPQRRYQSAAALHEDLRRLLVGEPIEAKRDSRVYVLRKTLRLYRRWVVAASILVSLLVVFSAVVTVLYSDARTARATSEARADFGRLGSTYLLQHLDEMHSLRNAMIMVAEQFPDHTAVHRLARPQGSVPIVEIESLLRTAPAVLGDFPLSTKDEIPEEIRIWIEANAVVIRGFRESTQVSRSAFGAQNAQSSWIVAHQPSDWYPVQRLCGVFTVAAIESAFSGRDDEALGDLDAAQSLALDLADGSTFVHKDAALMCRKYTYVAYLSALQALWPDGARLDRWANWLESDPPLPSLQDIMIAETMKVLQIVEGSIREVQPGGNGHVDLELLDRVTGGLYSQLGRLTEPATGIDTSFTPMEVFSALQRFGDDARAKFGATELHPLRPTEQSAQSIRHDAALQLLGPLLPSLGDGIRFHTQVAAWRLAARWARDLCVTKNREGAWPRPEVLGRDRADSTFPAKPTGSYRVVLESEGGTPQVTLERTDRDPGAGAGMPPDESFSQVVFRPRNVK